MDDTRTQTLGAIVLSVNVASVGHTDGRMECAQVPCHDLVLGVCGIDSVMVFSILTIRDSVARSAMAFLNDSRDSRVSDDILGAAGDKSG